jgi:hypothetical protein
MSTKLTELPDKFSPGFLAEMDRRTDIFKTLHSNYQEIVQDAGGQPNLAHIMISLIERFVFLEAICQHLEKQIVENPKKTVLVNRWIQAVNSLQGLACRIGLERRVSDTPVLKAYLAAE